MKLDELTLGEIKQLQSVFSGTVNVLTEDWGLNIVILQRGWVVMGKLKKKADYFTLTDGAVIRRWGTDKGLGQLAREGKQSETILEPTPETRFHELTVVGIIKCDESKW
jgi:hypothetical protein